MQMHPMFKKSTPKGLTPVQKLLFEDISKRGYELFCNEGSNYICWLEKNGKFIRKVNNRTANSLSDKGLIIIDDSFVQNNKFRMKLA